jgi:hypothetical protein
MLYGWLIADDGFQNAGIYAVRFTGVMMAGNIGTDQY